jgi:hypothetical protein
VAILLAIILLRAQTFPDDARVALNQYIEYRYPLSHPPTIQRVVPSSLPWNFTAAMSHATFGDSVFFQTTHGYQAQTGINLPGFPTVTPGASNWQSGGGGRPVPFPPVDVWCILLRDEDQSSEVVYVAEHQDLYNADWLVHEAAGSSKETNAALSKIGCDLKLGE